MQQQEIIHLQSNNKGIEEFEKFPRACPICQKELVGVSTRIDRIREILEVHCNRCGLSYDPEGNFRAVPTYNYLKLLESTNGSNLIERAINAGIPLMNYEPNHTNPNCPSIWAHGMKTNYLKEI